MAALGRSPQVLRAQLEVAAYEGLVQRPVQLRQRARAEVARQVHLHPAVLRRHVPLRVGHVGGAPAVDVRDAVVVGGPDARFGERICAVVEPETGVQPTLQELAQFVHSQLAGYKAPRELVVVESIGRAPNGKVDYKAIKDRALKELGVAA